MVIKQIIPQNFVMIKGEYSNDKTLEFGVAQDYTKYF